MRVFLLGTMMPLKPSRPCKYPGCPALTDNKSGYCPQHLKEIRQRYDSQRNGSTARGYDWQWQKYRKAYLAEHPLCVECEKLGWVKAATTVDHIIPVSGPDDPLFWAPNNHQSLCTEHHNRKTAKEDGGFGNRGRGD